jgi:hypothetical protein
MPQQTHLGHIMSSAPSTSPFLPSVYAHYRLSVTHREKSERGGHREDCRRHQILILAAAAVLRLAQGRSPGVKERIHGPRGSGHRPGLPELGVKLPSPPSCRKPPWTASVALQSGVRTSSFDSLHALGCAKSRVAGDPPSCFLGGAAALVVEIGEKCSDALWTIGPGIDDRDHTSAYPFTRPNLTIGSWLDVYGLIKTF